MMQDWAYAKEPFDFRLFVLRFLKKSWLVAAAMLVGAVLIGGGYYLKNVVFGGPTEYDITTTYYVEYNCFDPVTGEMFNYTNAATWKSWVVSDWFVDRAWEHALEDGMVPEEYGVVKSDLKGYFAADLPSDLRMPTSTVKTPSEGLTELLNYALQQTFMDFGVEQTEMDEIRITDETPLAVAERDVRTLNACILGALVGAFVVGFGLAFAIIWDDSIVVPETFTYRYGLPMAGYVEQKDTALSKEVMTNLQYLLKDKQKAGVLAVGSLEKAEKLFGMLPEGFGEILSAASIGEDGYEKLRGADGVLLLVEAGVPTGKEIEHVLNSLKLQDIQVTGALLYHAEGKLIHWYRFGHAGR
ncbi:MAG: hypothetical protein IJ379_11230 [Lachnospiraceae bacterium]|nr:hypothetical protein [Lachnospiraceae bacterium]